LRGCSTKHSVLLPEVVCQDKDIFWHIFDTIRQQRANATIHNLGQTESAT